VTKMKQPCGSQKRSGRPGVLQLWHGVVACVVTLCACSTSSTESSGTVATSSAAAQTTSTSASPTDVSTSSPSATSSTPLRLVALGDSDTTGHGDSTGAGWVGRYADLVETQTGRRVDVANLATDGLTSDRLLDAVQNNVSLRENIATADFILIGEGGADLNAGDDRFDAGTCSAEACYRDDLAAFSQHIDDVTSIIVNLRKDQPTVLRAITLPNGLTGAEDVIPPFLVPVAAEVGVFLAESLRQSICAAMQKHGGQCIDVLRAFNGPDGTDDAYQLGLMNHEDCCYPSDTGHQLMAELLVKTGLEPVTLT
jgi:lysophospholipase L1-like esterase